MSLRKPATLTPARIEANRRNAMKSTGPRTARGKAHSCLNAFKNAAHSPLLRRLVESYLYAPAGSGYATAIASLTPEQAALPVFARELEIIHYAEFGTFAAPAELRIEKKRGPHNKAKRSLNPIENTGRKMESLQNLK